jgi:hypothetical protein
LTIIESSRFKQERILNKLKPQQANNNNNNKRVTIHFFFLHRIIMTSNNTTFQRTPAFWRTATIVVVLAIVALQSTVVQGFTTPSHKNSMILRPATVSLQASVEATGYATCGKCGSSYALDEAALGGGNGRYVGEKGTMCCDDSLCVL